MTFEQRPKRSEKIWGRDALAERNRKYISPEVRMTVVYSRNGRIFGAR